MDSFIEFGSIELLSENFRGEDFGLEITSSIARWTNTEDSLTESNHPPVDAERVPTGRPPPPNLSRIARHQRPTRFPSPRNPLLFPIPTSVHFPDVLKGLTLLLLMLSPQSLLVFSDHYMSAS
ncbi:hypothetical protein FA15DRAFT_760194 [Coprinopsis marcescibilis]|uniref:Uncharacterized protein n=1 Tax=Coprinopsis marcescibilis TaxID=230819 RepID=A0A5C3KG80_COPMA|nr:hypothetical protein FA15DRAFT_760194 [Coprinopsis marcescibilis]